MALNTDTCQKVIEITFQSGTLEYKDGGLVKAVMLSSLENYSVNYNVSLSSMSPTCLATVIWSESPPLTPTHIAQDCLYYVLSPCNYFWWRPPRVGPQFFSVHISAIKRATEAAKLIFFE